MVTYNHQVISSRSSTSSTPSPLRSTRSLASPVSNPVSNGAVTAEWLDAHFLAMQPEYEEMLDWVDIQPGWSVLDAGCGSGSFLPFLANAVGSTGKVSAIDLAAEKIQVVENAISQQQWSAPVEARVGNILELPYKNGSFDAIWCANITQYLDDDELYTLFREFRRVVRPGGLIAIKDYDVTAQQFQPTTPRLFSHLGDALVRAGSAHFCQLFRVINLSSWLRKAGLREVRQKPTLMARFFPSRPIERQFFCTFLQYLASQAKLTDLPADELRLWAELADVDSPNHITNHLDFQYRTIQTVFVGQVP